MKRLPFFLITIVFGLIPQILISFTPAFDAEWSIFELPFFLFVSAIMVFAFKRRSENAGDLKIWKPYAFLVAYFSIIPLALFHMGIAEEFVLYPAALLNLICIYTVFITTVVYWIKRPADARK